MSTRAAYNAGTVDDWRAACTAARVSDSSTPQQRRALFETHFRPFKVLAPSDTSSKLTGYFEPMLKVSAVKTLEFDTPIASKPDDIITVDVSEFHGASGEGRIVGKLEGSRLKPYDTRSEISGQPQSAIAWGNAADVFYLQIQGSGRLQFPDGREFRAAYAAHNGQPFVSIAKHLINEGEIEPHQAGIDGVKSWMAKAGHDAAQAAMNVNPRYVWFAAEEIADPEKGPRGAEGVALTPMGSMAVDPSYHAYGVPIFLDTLVPQKPGDWKGEPFQSLVIAQDTGGAIRGAARGDLFFGWGDVAGGRAGSMNHPVDMWVLLPTQLVSQADWAG